MTLANDYERKQFVEGPLQDLVQGCAPYVERLKFMPEDRNCMECVHVFYAGAEKPQRICTECDSLLAMARDVLRAIR